jgi:hypothetical protein
VRVERSEIMFVIREVLKCKPGKVRQMVEKFRAISSVLKEMGPEPLRVLTDVTGRAILDHSPVTTGSRSPGPPSADQVQRFLATSARYGYWNASPEENARVGIALPF